MSVPLVVARLFVVLNALQELGRFRPHVALIAPFLRRDLEVPVSAPSDGFWCEDAIFGKSVVEGSRTRSIEEISISGL